MPGAAPLTASARFCIGPNHPALPGHFPGAPIVPGVLLLAEGLQQLAVQCGRALACRRVERARFLQPVAPGATIAATLRLDAAGAATLDLHVGAVLVAQAIVLLAQSATESAAESARA